MQQHYKCLVFIFLLLLVGLDVNAAGAASGNRKSDQSSSFKDPEGSVSQAEIVVGPFDLHRKYRSMEGPYVSQKFRISDLLASQKVTMPEGSVVFIEGGGEPAKMGAGPSMTGAADSSAGTGTSKAPVGLTDTKNKPRELLWFKGMKLDVLDENDKPLPTAEFICHLNLDVDSTFRNTCFPDGERCQNRRIVTLTQGQTQFFFPPGFAVPTASDEEWTFVFQAANRTTDQHRRVKHRCNLYFVKDSDLVYPVKALHWYVPYVQVVVDRDTTEAANAEHNSHPDCLGMSPGVKAPNSVPDSTQIDKLGRALSGHWVVPPGVHTYSSPIVEERDPGFASKDRKIHAAWTHIHPLCTKTSIVKCDRAQRQTVVETHSKTSLAGGLELKSIETISSKEGILMPAGEHYELQATYDNKSAMPQDSMVVMGLFFVDEKFVRPDWRQTRFQNMPAFCGVTSEAAGATENKEGASCKLVSTNSSSAAQPEPERKAPVSHPHEYPLFDTNHDGPLITEAKKMELDTTAGKIHLVLDPGMAPKSATQIYKLMKSGAFNGTPIFRYEPKFVMQTANAESKADGQPQLSNQLRDMLRRLPLEVDAQNKGLIAHKEGVLSMGRWDDDEDSAVSSFSVLLGDAPHLDHKYTIFGRIVADTVTTATVQHIIEQWPNGHPWIIKASEM